MGTNFYAHTNECHCCKRVDIVHLGKRSGGWTFSFQASESVRNFDDWCKLVRSASRVEDEYGYPLTPDEMIKEASTWQVGKGKRHADYYLHESWIDEYGHSFSSSDFS
jgi:hypothetical protein